MNTFDNDGNIAEIYTIRKTMPYQLDDEVNQCLREGWRILYLYVTEKTNVAVMYKPKNEK
jgi:hypothetical protein